MLVSDIYLTLRSIRRETGAHVLTIDIPGMGRLDLEHLVLDVNGTLACDGELIAGVGERIARLREQLAVHLLTANAYGAQDSVDARLGLTAVRLGPGGEAEAKAAFARSLGAASVVAVGNGANDTLMLREAAVGIAVLGREGLAGAALREADVVAASIGDALDLLLSPRRLSATLRR